MPQGTLSGRLLSVARQSVALSREQAVMRWESARLAYRCARGPACLFLATNAAAAVLLVGYVFFSGELLAAIPAAVRAGWSSAASTPRPTSPHCSSPSCSTPWSRSDSWQAAC